MNLHERIGSIKSREDLADFVEALIVKCLIATVTAFHLSGITRLRFTLRMDPKSKLRLFSYRSLHPWRKIISQWGAPLCMHLVWVTSMVSLKCLATPLAMPIANAHSLRGDL